MGNTVKTALLLGALTGLLMLIGGLIGGEEASISPLSSQQF